MPFSFLNFPYLVRKNLVDQMTDIDLVRVSLQNQAADNSLRECGKPDVSFYKLSSSVLRQLSSFDKLELFICEAKRSGITASWPINLSVSIHDAYFLSLKNDNGFEVRISVDNLKNFDKYDHTLRMGDLNVPCVIAENRKVEIYTLWDNEASGVVSILKFFNEDLGIPLDKLTVDGVGRKKGFSKNLRKIMEYINSMRNRLGKIEIGAKKSLSGADFKYLLQNVAVSGLFETYNRSRKKFELNGHIQAKSISLQHAHWFKMEHLLASVDYEEILIEGSKFTNDELKEFMTLWKDGKYPKLTEVTLGMDQPSFWEALSGFEERRRLARRRVIYQIERELYGFGSCTGLVTAGHGGKLFEMSVYHGE